MTSIVEKVEAVLTERIANMRREFNQIRAGLDGDDLQRPHLIQLNLLQIKIDQLSRSYELVIRKGTMQDFEYFMLDPSVEIPILRDKN